MRYLKLLFILIILPVLYGCKSVKYVPVEHTSYKNHEVLRTDSIHTHDSIYIYIKGDTVYHTRWRDRFHEVTRTDTIFLRETIPKIVEVERDFTFWERTKIKTWNFLLSVIVIICFVFIIKLVFKKWFGAS